jgi:hypothetical protein
MHDPPSTVCLSFADDAPGSRDGRRTDSAVVPYGSTRRPPKGTTVSTPSRD